MPVTTASPTSSPTVELAPFYALPAALILAALPILFFQVWVSLAIALLGVFLLFQTVVIRLRFTETDLDVYRSDRLLRRFPYRDWQNWRVFWPSFPILFYFKEVNSIHFLPVLFDPQVLRQCLEARCPRT